MSNWAPKRFWSRVTVTETDTGFGILLDEKPVNTPSKTRLIVPTRGLADLIAIRLEVARRRDHGEATRVARLTKSVLFRPVNRSHPFPGASRGLDWAARLRAHTTFIHRLTSSAGIPTFITLFDRDESSQ